MASAALKDVVLEDSQVASDASAVSSKPWILVTHQRPDTDAHLCLWAADRFIVPSDAPRVIMFVEAGERLSPETEAEAEQVLYMDVGGGDLDQHGKQLNRASSFQLVIDHYGLNDDGAFDELIELACATDNVEEVSRTSIHYVIKGLPAIFRGGTVIDWAKVTDFAFVMFDTVHSQAKLSIAAHAAFKKLGRTFELPNKLRLSTVWWNAGLRDAAYESGAHVVMWTGMRGKNNNVEFGIQVSRRASKVSLRHAMACIRQAEAHRRGIEITLEEAHTIGTLPALPGWFLHDSEKLILSGSRARRLQGEEYSRLKPEEVLAILKQAFSKL